MKQQQTLQPKLRFPEFEADWNEFKFKELYEFKSTNSLSRDKLNYEKHNVKNIHYGDIHVKFKTLFDITKENVPYINEDIDLSKISEDNYLKEGDVIIADASENYDDIGKAIEIINLNNEKVISGLHTFLARKISDLNYNGFISYVFKTKIYRHQIYKIAQGTKVLSLSSNRVANLNINIPSLPEQQKIADYLATIDNKINLLEEKKAQLTLYKKAMMQKLFSQEIRFKDDNGNDFPEWEEKRLKEISEFRRGSFPQPYGLAKWYDDENGYPFVQVYDVDDNFKLKQNTKRKISSLATKSSVFVKKGTLLITIQGSIGRIAITEFDCYVDRTLLIITSLDIKLHIDYYKYCLFLLFEIEKHKAPGGTIKTITKEVLSDFVIPFPCLPEQQKIADFLSAIDESIEKVNEQITQTQSFKKAMLQGMFV